MDFAAIIDGIESFAAYVGELASVIGHVGRVAPLHDYCAGLLNKVSLGFVEGLNNKIRVIQRRAYGLRDEDYLRLKILTCMLPAL
jgi:transposase